MTRRLYLRLYFAFLGIAALSLLVTALLVRVFHEPAGLVVRTLTPLASSLDCTPAAGCQGESAQHLREAARALGLDLVVWEADGRPLFEAVRSPLPLPAQPTAGWHHTPRGGLWLLPLDGGRLFGLRERGHFGARGRMLLPMLFGLAALFAIGLYPLSRSITRRVEALAEGARRWGAGDLGHRVAVQGKDEIAALAAQFNQTAAAIETLLAQERQMLATASHELRTPLARVRLALELLAEGPEAARRQSLVERSTEDIAELDALVEELLLATRAQPGVPRRPFATFDLLAVVRAETEAAQVTLAGEPLTFTGDEAMLRRMVRNLLLNARLHGQGSAVRAEVRRHGPDAIVAVEDDGPGVPESERERIFAPFYRAPGPRPPGDTGLGLGLALCRQIARYHGGDIGYVAREPHGSRFEVRLPAQPAA